MKKVFIKMFTFVSIVLLGSGLAFSQSNNFVTNVISSDSITYGQTAYLIMCDLNLVQESASESEAVYALEENFPKLVAKLSIQNVEQKLTAKQFSYICYSVYDVKTSLMFMICKTPRYAFRQMKAANYFAQNEAPSVNVSGRKALLIIADLSEKASKTQAQSMMMSR